MEIEFNSPTGKTTALLEKGIDIPMRDGALLNANVFRPTDDSSYPVLMTLGPYSKDIHFRDHRLESWETLVRDFPEIFEHSSGEWMVFETPDPEIWVPEGYVIVRVDSRGAARSPGCLNVNSPQEFQDFHDAIEWAAAQPWCSGKVGLLGISYYACGQWMTAAMKPPHLVAILPWQGTCDFYRGRTRQGGIFCSGFVGRWWNMIKNKQHGNTACELVDIITSDRITGPAELSEEELAANREEYIENVLQHPLLDDWYRERSGDLSKIEIPALVVANWGGLGLHLSGTIRGFTDIVSPQKWLKVQSGSYFATFFKPESVAIQRRFFDHFLKGEDNGWEKEPRVEVAVRGLGDTVTRIIQDREWPVSSTRWTRLHLDAGANALSWSAPEAAGTATYSAKTEGAAFASAPLEGDLEIAGPIKARLCMSSTQPDMDLYVTLQAFGPDGTEATFFAADEPRLPVSQGWLRATHRKLDPAKSTEWQPYHAHDEFQPLTPGEVYEIDVEVWPCSISLPAGSTLSFLVAAKDFARPDAEGPMKGSGPFTHGDPVDCPPEKHAGDYTVHSGGGRESYLQLPVIPAS